MAKYTIDLSGFKVEIPKHIKDFDPSYVTRYLITAQLIKEIEKKEKRKLKILDVGGYNGAISNFFPDHDITIIDIIEDKKAKNYVQANGAHMPFQDGEFDLVISCDALEHVLPNERKGFISEMTRVTKNHLLLCAPFSTPNVERAELLSDSFYTSMTGESYIWLKEHREYVLPKKDWLTGVLKEKSMNSTYFSHTSLDLWVQMVCGNFFLAGNVAPVDTRLANKLRSVNEEYLKNIAAGDFPEDGYRTFFVASKKHDLTVKLPQYKERAIEQFMRDDVMVIGGVLSKMTRKIGVLGDQKQQVERQFKLVEQQRDQMLAERDTLASELTALKSSRKYKIAQIITAPKRAIKKARRP